MEARNHRAEGPAERLAAQSRPGVRQADSGQQRAQLSDGPRPSLPSDYRVEARAQTVNFFFFPKEPRLVHFYKEFSRF